MSTNLNFFRVDTLPIEGVVGGIYFLYGDTNKLYIYTSNGYEEYTGGSDIAPVDECGWVLDTTTGGIASNFVITKTDKLRYITSENVGGWMSEETLGALPLVSGHTYQLTNEAGEVVSVVFTGYIDTKYVRLHTFTGELNTSDTYTIVYDKIINNSSDGFGAIASGVNTTALGDASHAEGNTTTAKGNYSHAEGSSTTANGSASHAEGYNSITGSTYTSNDLTAGTLNTSGAYAHAEGNATIAKGVGSHSEGMRTFASGNYSHAEGSDTTALGTASHAEGDNNLVTNDYSHAEGRKNAIIGTSAPRSHVEGSGNAVFFSNSHAEGSDNISHGYISHIEGAFNTVTGYAAHVEGFGNIASGDSAHVEGGIAEHESDYLYTVELASATYNSSTGVLECVTKTEIPDDKVSSCIAADFYHGTGRWDLNSYWIKRVEKLSTTKYEFQLHEDALSCITNGIKPDPSTSTIIKLSLLRRGNIASGNCSHAEGKFTKAQGVASHTEGNNTVAEGSYSHAEGHNTLANGDASHAEGNGTQAKHYCSHAEGLMTIANGESSHAEGYNTNASDYSSHAEGINTTSGGVASHTEGIGTTAKGEASHAEGYNTNASGDYSHAEGGGNSISLSLSLADYDTNKYSFYGFTGDVSYLKVGTVIRYNNLFYKITYISINGEDGQLKTDKLISGILFETVTVDIVLGTAYGEYSHSEGNKTVASGDNSHAEGDSTIAKGDASHAEGIVTIAEGFASHAEGEGTTASGDYSHTEGYNTKASSYSSHAEGAVTIASGESSHAEGNGTTASSSASHAEGKDTKANGSASHAEGLSSEARGNGSHAEGILTFAKGTDGSHSEGWRSYAYGSVSHSEGYASIASGSASHASGIRTKAKGTGSHTEGGLNAKEDRYILEQAQISNVVFDESNMTITFDTTETVELDGVEYQDIHIKWGEDSWDDDYYFIERIEKDATITNTNRYIVYIDSFYTKFFHNVALKITICKTSNIAEGAYSHAEGTFTKSVGTASHAEGSGTTARGDYSHAEGYQTTANGNYSHAEGSGTKASGNFSHVEGGGTKANGITSHAEGYYSVTGGRYTSNILTADDSTTSSGAYAHAEGNATIAKGVGSHSEGKKTFASGTASHAEGSDTTASGIASHAEGSGTKAGGSYSHAEGYYTITNNDYEHAEGKYNVSNDGTISSIGIGTTDSAGFGQTGYIEHRMNAVEVMNNGDMYVYGLGDYDGTNAVGNSSLTGKTAETLQSVINSKAPMGEYLPLAGGTMQGNINFKNDRNSIYGDDNDALHLDANNTINLDALETHTYSIFPQISTANIGSSSNAFNDIYSKRFVKVDSNDSYVLLGGGGTKLLSEIGTSSATVNEKFKGFVTDSTVIAKDQLRTIDDYWIVSADFTPTFTDSFTQDVSKSDPLYVGDIIYVKQAVDYPIEQALGFLLVYGIIRYSSYLPLSGTRAELPLTGPINIGNCRSLIDQLTAVLNVQLSKEDEEAILNASNLYVPLVGCTDSVNNHYLLMDICYFSENVSSPKISFPSGICPGQVAVDIGHLNDMFDKVYASHFIANPNSTDILLANGTTLSLSELAAAEDYLPLTGGELTGPLHINVVGAGGDTFAENYTNFVTNKALVIGPTEAGSVALYINRSGIQMSSTHTDGDSNTSTLNIQAAGGNTTFGGNVNAPKFVNTSSSDDYVLLGGGSTKLLSKITEGYLPLSGGTMTGDIIPNTNAPDIGIQSTMVTYNLGDSSHHFNNVYARSFKGLADGACQLYGYEKKSDNSISLTPLPITRGDNNTPVYFNEGIPVACDWSVTNFAKTEDLSNYLPLAGGTMSGHINFASGSILFSDGQEGSISIAGQGILQLMADNKVTSTVLISAPKFVNTTSNDLHVLLGGGGTKKITEITAGYLPLTGGTMTGDIIMSAAKIEFAEEGGTIYSNGAVCVGGSLLIDSSAYANAFYETSDIRKKDIKSDLSLDKCYDLIDKCQTIIYSLKDQTQEQIGMIAQEIEEFFPEVIATDEEGFKSLAYDRLVVICFKVLKDVIKRLEKLEFDESLNCK